MGKQRLPKRPGKAERIAEAVKRLEMLGVDEKDIEKYREDGKIPGSFTNHAERHVRRFIPGEEQNKIIADLEKDRGLLIFYVMVDTGMWTDGRTFERWTFLALSSYKDDWETERESITECNTVLSYVYNCEVPEYSELCEAPFMNVKGALVNIG